MPAAKSRQTGKNRIITWEANRKSLKKKKRENLKKKNKKEVPSSKSFQKNCTQATSTKENYSPWDSVVVTSLAQTKAETRVWRGALRHISNIEWCIWTSRFCIKSYKLSGILVFACLCFEGQTKFFSLSPNRPCKTWRLSHEAADQKHLSPRLRPWWQKGILHTGCMRKGAHDFTDYCPKP